MSAPINDGGAAFHAITCKSGDNYNSPTAGGPNIDGAPINMTREHADKIAKGCYRIADAMIAARKETEA